MRGIGRILDISPDVFVFRNYIFSSTLHSFIFTLVYLLNLFIEIIMSQDVKGYPTLAYFRDGRKVEAYSGARTLGELKDFVVAKQEMIGDEANEDGKVPDIVASPVIKVDKDNFDETIKEGVTFVKVIECFGLFLFCLSSFNR